MESVLFANYGDSLFNPHQGGPQNIIYKLINKMDQKNFKLGYISYDYTLNNIIPRYDYEADKRNIKKLTNKLFKNYLYRSVVMSDYYLPIHHWKKMHYFRNVIDGFANYNICHAFDSVILALINHSMFEKKIITVQSKGPLSAEMSRNIKNKNFALYAKNKLRELEMESLEVIDKLTFPSVAALRLFEENLSITLPRSKIEIIYNGIDQDYIESISPEGVWDKYNLTENSTLLILNVATNVREKNLSEILKAIKHLKKNKGGRRILLINVGANSSDKYLNGLISELGIEQNVRLLGKIPNQDVIRLMKICDIFLMTSTHVIFDVSVLEAMACKSCVIVSNNGGNKEVVEDEVDGYFLNTINSEEIAEKIMTIDLNKTRLNAQKKSEKFSIDSMAEQYTNLYEKLDKK